MSERINSIGEIRQEIFRAERLRSLGHALIERAGATEENYQAAFLPVAHEIAISDAPDVQKFIEIWELGQRSQQKNGNYPWDLATAVRNTEATLKPHEPYVIMRESEILGLEFVRAGMPGDPMFAAEVKDQRGDNFPWGHLYLTDTAYLGNKEERDPGFQVAELDFKFTGRPTEFGSFFRGDINILEVFAAEYDSKNHIYSGKNIQYTVYAGYDQVSGLLGGLNPNKGKGQKITIDMLWDMHNSKVDLDLLSYPVEKRKLCANALVKQLVKQTLHGGVEYDPEVATNFIAWLTGSSPSEAVKQVNQHIAAQHRRSVPRLKVKS